MTSSGPRPRGVGPHEVATALSPARQHAALVIRHPGGDHAITAMHSVPDDAWYPEPDVVAGQRALVTAIVPDEDPSREPTVCFNPHAGHVDVPYRVMRWFMYQVDEEIRTFRAWGQMGASPVGGSPAARPRTAGATVLRRVTHVPPHTSSGYV